MLETKLVEVLLPLGEDGHVLVHHLVSEEHVLVSPHGGGHLTGQHQVTNVGLGATKLLTWHNVNFVKCLIVFSPLEHPGHRYCRELCQQEWT